jgi:hypothetical protein
MRMPRFVSLDQAAPIVVVARPTLHAVHHDDVDFSGKGEQYTYRACEEGGGSEALDTAPGSGEIQSSAHGQLNFVSVYNGIGTFESGATTLTSNRHFGEWREVLAIG